LPQFLNFSIAKCAGSPYFSKYSHGYVISLFERPGGGEDQMNDLKKKNRTVTIIRLIARILSIISIAFILIMVVPHLFFPQQSKPPTFGEIVGLFFFPFGVFIGLIVAWKSEGPGGMIAIGSVICFHVTMLITGGSLDLNPFIEGLAVPGLLFLIWWFLSRGRLETKEAG
jgi:hypothetical protein